MKTTYEKIKSADVLIVGEVSMFIKRHFENLEFICSLKNPSQLFGGMQIIFCGDFFQLPPVRNILYDDDGSYCFESDLFDMVFVHKVFLKDVVRQTQYDQEKVIGEDTISLMDQLSRPLADNGMSSLKPFATNQMADDDNRNQILKMEGDLF
ncbi:hypothetical protein ACJMK2_008234 [Sinanodonta woodiana]|uniref:ATP-dependent DNA helicase n=1 Tax=Sinanodonta woodiana TaxID=1069815 RepID=A0ABD3VP03_SINWO